MTDPDAGKDDSQADKAEIAARKRLRLPARFLLLVSVLNVVTGIYLMVHAIILKKQGADAEVRQRWDIMLAKPGGKEIFEGWTADSFVTATANGLLGYGGISGLISVLTLAGARRMLELRSYGFAVTAAVLTAIPCMTPCCFLGQAAGVWAFVMLMQPDVRRAFQ